MDFKETAKVATVTYFIAGPLVVFGIIALCKALIWGLPRLTSALEWVTR